jgi:hypothetical protein
MMMVHNNYDDDDERKLRCRFAPQQKSNFSLDSVWKICNVLRNKNLIGNSVFYVSSGTSIQTAP